MATQPPPAPRKTRRSQTVLSPVPTEIPDGAIMVHSTDSTIAVPSHGGDSVAHKTVLRWRFKFRRGWRLEDARVFRK